MELTTTHRIYYSNKRHVPLLEIAESLLALEGIIRQSPPILENIFPGTQILDVEIYLNKLHSGSLFEDVLIKIVFGSQETFDQFIASARERLGLDHLKTNNQLLSAIIVILALSGGSYYLGKNNGQNGDNQAVIQNNYNLVINNGAKMIEMDPEEFKSVIENGITDKNKLAKDAIKFVKPANRDEGADITFDGNTDLSVTSAAVKAMPGYLSELEEEKEIEHYDRTEIKIRATDLDSFKKGWAAIVPKISNRRVKLHIDPTINSEDILQHPTLLGSVTVIFQLDDSGNKIPTLYILKEIYMFIEDDH